MTRRELTKAFGALAATSAFRWWPATFKTSTLAPDQTTPSSPALPKSVAGVLLPDSRIANQATELSREVSPPFLFNHAVRTFLFGALTGKALGQSFDNELLYLACILHDLGLTERFMGNLPFEIQGAQSASHFLEEQGLPKQRAAVVWDGIAMHASLIGQFKQPEVALVGAGAGSDVIGPDRSRIKKEDVDEILKAFPRLKFKDEFMNICANVVRRHPRAAKHTFMRDIGERYVPGLHFSNICDEIRQSPFQE